MRNTVIHSVFILIFYSLIHKTSAYSVYVLVSRMKDFVDGPFAYMFVEETIGNRDCQYLNVTTSYIQDNLNFTRNNCSSTLYPRMAAVYKHRLYPRNLSHIISEDKSLTFMCTPLEDYTDDDSMEYNCALTRATSFHPPASFAFDTVQIGDFTGQIVVIPALIFLAILLLLASFLFRPLHPVLQ